MRLPLSDTAPLPPLAPRTLALVGCGHVAERHAGALQWHGQRLNVVGVVDPDAYRRQTLATLLEAPAFASLDALLAETSPELVSIATPTGLHCEQALVAARHGADVILEKPLSTSLDAARAMVKQVQELGHELFVIKQLRHHPLFLALRDAVRRGRFGRIFSVGLEVYWNRNQAYYDAASWRGTRELDGGALMNQASHYVDLLAWIFDEPDELYAAGGTLGRRIDVEDTALLTLRWPGGALGSVHVSMLAYPRNITTSLTVLGERGTVRLGGARCDQIEAWEFEEHTPQDDAIEGLASSVQDILSGGHAHVFGAILDHLDGVVDAPIVTGEEGLRSLAIIDAAYASMRAHQPLRLER
ncbi:Gfo/Idh/MocA family oxidoreductase [Lujinxingia vulgaris]|uniref:Gfo/Idh/MocA family oxidoreductase n=1 Tax=Lujinxingia vulgaris TaxID=2600176 RepID=A0A5C6XD02_9DELT|nr:Gfo/Idh/MocA family oxidoreductase [Lujinxingia vulgaris]TXD36659.1 Gfo/Idh/MocA family oxidoreductase [Lujinxingia vulgaris]